jgi:hypothetical protein
MMDRYTKGQRHVRETSIADPDHLIRIRLSTLIRTFLFDTYLDPTFYVETDPDPYRFKEIMYLKRYRKLFIHLNLIFLVSRTARSQTAGIR